jgi:SAM-dependent methyltransferase
MSLTTHYSDYDIFARIYNEEWGQGLGEFALRPLEKLVLPHLSEGSKIFDIGCGTGQLAQELVIRGYQVTGLDGSEAMLDYARKNAPNAQFIAGDARFFEFTSSFDAIISTSAALNHVINIDELIGVFHNVYAALFPNGHFLFDMNLDERYKSNLWNGVTQGNITDEYAWAVRQSYAPEGKIGKIETTTFQLLNGAWQRSDVTWLVQGYSKSEVISALEKVGFTEVNIYDAEHDFAINGKAGNAYFICRKS